MDRLAGAVVGEEGGVAVRRSSFLMGISIYFIHFFLPFRIPSFQSPS